MRGVKVDDKYWPPAAIILTLVSIYLCYSFMGRIQDTIENLNRPPYVETQGTMLTMSKGPAVNSGGGGTSYPLIGTYEFSVNGTPYAGTQIGYYAREGRWDTDRANQIIEQFNQSKQITIRYDPNNPARNLADVKDDPDSFGTVMGAAGFVAICGMMCLGLWIQVLVNFISRLRRG